MGWACFQVSIWASQGAILGRCASAVTPRRAISAFHLREHVGHVAHDRHVDAHVLGDRRGIDVDVDLLRAAREGVRAWPVTRSSKRAPHRDQEIGLSIAMLAE